MMHDDPRDQSRQPGWRPSEPSYGGNPPRADGRDPYAEPLLEDDRLLDYEPLESERVIELREEQLIPHTEMREVGEVVVRTEVDEIPGRIEVEARREEVEVLHEPVGQVVSERRAPWEEDDALVVPVYEEQLVVVKRLVLREHLRIRRVTTRERQVFQDTLLKERLVVEDPDHTGFVHERYPDDDEPIDRRAADRHGRDSAGREEGGFLGSLKKALK